ncbi:MAG: hypothetical protein KGJ80_13215, partial [Chloroflexota bacterium]|nr:hypothetical protein [Chloroflexota bacterium]
MMSITVADVIQNALPESGWGSFCIYIFRDGGLVLYVGKAEQNVIDRLEDHLGISYRPESQIGRLIDDNAPESHNWQIDLLTLDDCRPIVAKHFPSAQIVDVLTIERAIILEFRPPLNRQSNPNARPLPRKYIH